ncbi:glucosaminidase domain-containing protein [Thiomicrorhabdus lithotrophica]|uniref:Glucosaminidase domain-containing protein n=1 Tax=Thiomicrorhabdus lithotrophica TaxID=2949997 RepID=A0ABY8CDC5_9GAMM|nr:glucosaminidase domain-containing protein [Thiomicrorhabdus lithotrophica]WEJ62536.1 glucosaminidase domain-containing protein [Thiomicrorhabdus lithotrophica]
MTAFLLNLKTMQVLFLAIKHQDKYIFLRLLIIELTLTLQTITKGFLMNHFYIVIALTLAFCSPAVIANINLPDFTSYKDVKQKKRAFFNYMLPYVKKANQEILAERKAVAAMNIKKLNNQQSNRLTSLLKKYRINDKQITKHTKKKLLKKIDVIPASLALAQAANESAWGTSRFAKKAHNFYGQWCFTKGCGLIPKQRSAGMSHEVKKFKSPYESIKGYMLNLNSHPAFISVRNYRAEQRKKHIKPQGVVLAKGLEKYSERKQEYIKEIIAMIRYNKLDVLDS